VIEIEIEEEIKREETEIKMEKRDLLNQKDLMEKKVPRKVQMIFLIS